jgi:predicted aldo/keto reductase-like oxidoreductase
MLSPRASSPGWSTVHAVQRLAHLLRSLNPTECLRYALSQPGVHVAICGAGTQGQMEDNIRAVRNFRRMTPDEIADVRERAVVGAGVHSGPTLEYWKRR